MEDAAQRVKLSFRERTGRTFGLGQKTKADSVEIQWPSGQVHKLSNINAGETVTVQEGKGVIASRAYGPAPKRPVATKVAKLSSAVVPASTHR